MNRNSFRRWMVCLLLGIVGATPLTAAEHDSAPGTDAEAGKSEVKAQGVADAGQASAGGGSLSLSGTSASKRAHWAEHLTLGAGDTLNLSLFDMPETARTEVPVGPDGRLTFLQARDI